MISANDTDLIQTQFGCGGELPEAIPVGFGFYKGFVRV